MATEQIDPTAYGFINPAVMMHHITEGEFELQPHITLIAEKLVEAAMGRCPRLMVNLPPGHGKSSLVSHAFPVWHKYLFPEKRLALVGYGDDFATTWGKAVQATIESHPELGIRIREGSAAAHRWDTPQGGGMLAVGTGGAFMGYRPHIIVIDDPIKDWNSLSHIQRESLWNWWVSVARTRLEPNGAIVILQHRWAEDDFCGRLLRNPVEKWDHVSIPALIETPEDAKVDPLGRSYGEPIWPSRFNAEILNVQRNYDPRVWASMYQQRPLPYSEAGMQRHWWRYWGNRGHDDYGREMKLLPSEFDLMMQSWDMRLKGKGGDGSFTVGQVWGLKDGLFFLIHQERGMFDLPETLDKVRRMRADFPAATAIVIEDAALGPAVVQMLKDEIPGLQPIPAKFSKEVRVRSRAVSPMIESGNVYIPDLQTTIWVPAFIEECVSFTGADKEVNDQVDALSQALSWMYNRMKRGIDKAQDEAQVQASQMKNTQDELRERIAAAVARSSQGPATGINPYAALRGRK